jgi:sterol desaturase/sphingolipid hydroxylase (fatty acid hydroxylase superfamily)
MLLSFFQSCWSSLQSAVPNPIVLEFGGNYVVQLLTFYLPALLFTALPFVWPAFAARHQFHPVARQPTWPKIRHAIAVTLRNQLMNDALSLVLYTLSGWQTLFDHSAALPSAWEIIRDVAVCRVLREVSFYYLHRSFHHPRLYAAVHKQHHQFNVTTAFAGQYAHPVEQFFVNLLPVVLPPQLLRVHVCTFWLLLSLSLLDSACTHSGFTFFSPSWTQVEHHDTHHLMLNGNYGSTWMDWLHGTVLKAPKTLKGEAQRGENESPQNAREKHL